MLHGENLKIIIDGTVWALAKSCDVIVQAKTIERSSASNGQWAEYISDRKSWEVKTSHLVSDARSMLLEVDSVVTLQLQVNGTAVMSGSAICTQCQITATRGNLIQGSFSWRGNGPLTSSE